MDTIFQQEALVGRAVELLISPRITPRQQGGEATHIDVSLE
jgi:hypothetical protein